MNKQYNHTRNQKRMYRIHKQEELIEKQKYIIGDLQERIDKAIEYIKKEFAYDDGTLVEADIKLLEILKGE